jgi:hypothetical protein
MCECGNEQTWAMGGKMRRSFEAEKNHKARTSPDDTLFKP